MNRYSFTDHYGNHFERISKRAAQKRYESGQSVTLCPAKLRPGYPWSPHLTVLERQEICVHSPTPEDPHRFAHIPEPFDHLVSNFVWYNCQHNEVGYYPAFYIESRKDEVKA